MCISPSSWNFLPAPTRIPPLMQPHQRSCNARWWKYFHFDAERLASFLVSDIQNAAPQFVFDYSHLAALLCVEAERRDASLKRDLTRIDAIWLINGKWNRFGKWKTCFKFGDDAGRRWLGVVSFESCTSKHSFDYFVWVQKIQQKRWWKRPNCTDRFFSSSLAHGR